MDNRTSTNGKVFLIGAGPGDPKLLTIRAAEAIANSEVIVYDYLVNPEILAHSRRDAELVYVGKRGGESSITQHEINKILIEKARRGLTVARLKGGDPFIFGRGGEEAEALVESEVAWEVIPGVSSGIAAASYAGIPLTHRHYASSVFFVTGHDGKKERGGVDWAAAAQAADTLVVFMCAESLRTIAANLIKNGRRPTTPIAIVRWATYEHQEVYTGTLADLIADPETNSITLLEIKPPVIAIIGDVVSLKEKLHWFGRPAFELSTADGILV
jgi:uroporphyrin-III C-methyltransferase